MSLRFAEPWGLLAGFAAAVLLVGLALLGHRALRGAAPARLRRLLLATRLLAALLLAALLLEPVLGRDRLRSEDLTVVVLLDRSRSMSVADSWGNRSRHRVAGEFLTAPDRGLLDLLGDGFRVVPLAFDIGVRPASGAELRGETLPTGELTDLAGALGAAAKAAPRSEVVGVVLLSDGGDNLGGDAAAAAAGLGLPVYAVGLGSREGEEAGRRDLALLSLDAPETAFAENTVVVEASVRSTGFDLADPGNRRVRVTLLEGESEIAGEVVEFSEDGAGAPVRVSLRFVPAGTGTRTYTVKLPVFGEETVTGNNRRTFSLNVLERSAAVLYFDATMRWEAKFLRDFLARDPAVDLTSVLHSGQARLLVNGDPHGADLSRGLPPTLEQLEEFDVVILGDVPAEALSPESLSILRAFVEGGGGLLTLGGYGAYGAGGYAGTPLAEALPVSMDSGDGQRETEIRVELTPAGRAHPALAGLLPWFAGATRPTLRGVTEVRGPRPGAEVLVTGEPADGGRTAIVLAVQRYGEGRSAAFTGDTSWVWYRSPELGGPDGLYRRFWGQLVRWLLEEDPEVEQAGEPLAVFPDRPGYRIGEVVRIRARVRDDEGRPVSDGSLTATLVGPAGREALELAPLPRLPGQYEARARALVPGAWRVEASGFSGGAPLGRATAEYTVAPESVEMDAIDLDEARLRAVARASGGRFYLSPPTAEPLAEDLRGSLVGLVERQELGLSDTPLFFLLFTALVSAEWILRRRRSLI